MRWSHLIATDKSIVNLHELKYFKSSILLLCVSFLCAFHALKYGLLPVYWTQKIFVCNLAQQLIMYKTNPWGYQTQNNSKSSWYFYRLLSNEMRSMHSYKTTSIRIILLIITSFWWCCCACDNLLTVIKKY